MDRMLSCVSARYFASPPPPPRAAHAVRLKAVTFAPPPRRPSPRPCPIHCALNVSVARLTSLRCASIASSTSRTASSTSARASAISASTSSSHSDRSSRKPRSTRRPPATTPEMVTSMSERMSSRSSPSESRISSRRREYLSFLWRAWSACVSTSSRTSSRNVRSDDVSRELSRDRLSSIAACTSSAMSSTSDRPPPPPPPPVAGAGSSTAPQPTSREGCRAGYHCARLAATTATRPQAQRRAACCTTRCGTWALGCSRPLASSVGRRGCRGSRSLRRPRSRGASLPSLQAQAGPQRACGSAERTCARVPACPRPSFL
mmetsp:Transcript_25300/g.84238  ORF Transcript_25300/g.84238 Transcript_25300/m.84238 type:complete len:318 (+) Transcript_25300:2143-3096(+)